MSYREPARNAARRRRPVILAPLAIVAATLLAVTGRWVGPSAAASSRGATARSTAHPAAVDGGGPAVARLDARLRRALRLATADAARDGIDVVLNGGWRSRAHQQRLFRDAVATYGSARAAARWVAPPDASAHVSGDAVDVGPARAAAWLFSHGATYGLCRIYRNEPWHYELRPDAPADGCPTMYADPTRDPRMQR